MKNKQIYKKIAFIAIPIALQNLINVGVGMMDTLMIGNISETQLSGIAQAGQPYFLFTLLIFGLASGSCVITAQYWGQKQIDPIKKILGLVLKIAMASGILLGIAVMSQPTFFMELFTNEQAVIEAGVQYLRIIGFSYVFSAFTGVFLIVLRSVENVNISMMVYGISFVINVFLNWVFIYGNLGFPRMEIQGAAIATLIARIVEALVTYYYIRFKEKALCFRARDLFTNARDYYRTLIRYSIPVLFSELHWGLGISVQAAIIGRLGANVLAAFSLVNILQQLAGVALIGVGAAAGILIGQEIGKDDIPHAKELAKVLIKISLGLGTVISILVILLSPYAPRLIQASPETSSYIIAMLWVASYMLFFQAINTVLLMGVLRGGGDTLYCAKLDVATLWILKLACGIFAAFYLKLDPIFVYFILLSDEMLKCFAAYPRYKRDQWIHVITIDTPTSSS